MLQEAVVIYPIKGGLVTSIPLPFDHLKKTDGYKLLVRREDIPKHGRNVTVYQRADGRSPEAQELRRIRKLPGKIQRRLERFVAYCQSGCPMIIVYVASKQMLIYLAGTVVSGAGAAIDEIQCRHKCGVPVPDTSKLLNLVPRPGVRRTVDALKLSNEGSR